MASMKNPQFRTSHCVAGPAILRLSVGGGWTMTWAAASAETGI